MFSEVQDAVSALPARGAPATVLTPAQPGDAVYLPQALLAGLGTLAPAAQHAGAAPAQERTAEEVVAAAQQRVDEAQHAVAAARAQALAKSEIAEQVVDAATALDAAQVQAQATMREAWQAFQDAELAYAVAAEKLEDKCQVVLASNAAADEACNSLMAARQVAQEARAELAEATKLLAVAPLLAGDAAEIGELLVSIYQAGSMACDPAVGAGGPDAAQGNALAPIAGQDAAVVLVGVMADALA